MVLFISALLRVLRSRHVGILCSATSLAAACQAFQPCPEHSEGEDLAEMGSVCI